MKSKSVFFAFMVVLAMTLPSLAQEDKLGKVSFPTSCDPKVQVQFERAVAMLHSLVQRWRKAVSRRTGSGPLVRNRHLGHRLPSHV